MRTIRIIIWLCLGPLLVATHCYAQDIQYYWVKADKVFLWKSAEDTNPVIATFEPAPRTWTITPDEETVPWQKILEDIAYKHYSDLKLDAYKKENKLLALMLTKLHNEYPNIPWATLREPYAQIFWQSDEAGGRVQVSFISKGAPPAESPIRTFTRTNAGGWQKSGNIDLKTLLNVEESSESLRTVFNLPASDSASTGAWPWDEFANVIFTGDQARPITYEDNDKKWHWIWLEKNKSANLPVKYFQIPKPPPVKEPDPPREEPDSPQSMTWPEIIRVIAISILIGALATLIVAAFVKRGELWKYVSNIIGGKNDKHTLDPPSTDTVIISAQGLDLLYQHTLELVQGLPQQKVIKRVATTGQPGNDLDEAGRNHLAQVLSWTHEQYLKIINTDQFREKAFALEEEILAAHYKKIGLEPADVGRIAAWIALGRAFETKVQADMNSSAFVKSIIKQQRPAGLKTPEDWMEYWPQLLNELGKQAENQQGELEEAKKRLEKIENEQKSDKDKIRQELKAEWEAKVTALDGDLTELKSKYDLTSNQLKTLEQVNKNLQTDLDQSKNQKEEAMKGRQAAENSVSKYKNVFDEIQEVKKLSRALRQWIQGYFMKQQNNNGDMRSVGLVAALVNYSLYQMCFSILEEHQSMRKAMAQNLFTFSRMFNQNANYSAVIESLKRLDSKVESKFDVPTNPAGNTIDDPLFQACLKSLQNDTGLNLGPFFIDEKENKINLVNAN